MTFLRSRVAIFAQCLLLAAGGTAPAGSYCGEQQHEAASDDFSTLVATLQSRRADVGNDVLATMSPATTPEPTTSLTPTPPNPWHQHPGADQHPWHRRKGKGKGRYPTLRCSECREKYSRAYCMRVCGALPRKFQGRKFKGKGGYPTLHCSECRTKYSTAYCKRVCGAFPGKFHGRKFKGKGGYPSPHCSQCRRKHGKEYCRRACGAFPGKLQGRKFKGAVKERRPGQSYHHGQSHHGHGPPQAFGKRPQQVYDASCPQPPCQGQQPDNQQIVTVNADFDPGAHPVPMHYQTPAYYPAPMPYQK